MYARGAALACIELNEKGRKKREPRVRDERGKWIGPKLCARKTRGQWDQPRVSKSCGQIDLRRQEDTRAPFLFRRLLHDRPAFNPSVAQGCRLEKIVRGTPGVQRRRSHAHHSENTSKRGCCAPNALVRPVTGESFSQGRRADSGMSVVNERWPATTKGTTGPRALGYLHEAVRSSRLGDDETIDAISLNTVKFR